MDVELRRFLHDVGSTVALIRHDKRPEAPPHPRGGFLVGKALLQETIEFFFALDRIVAVYEKADPLLNMHNINLMFENEREIRIEVVGPGFDASDLQRGDITPHESFSVSLSPEGAISDIKLVNRVDQTTYEEFVASRKDKLRKKLESSPSPGLARKIREDLGIAENLDVYLQTIKSPLCESQSYRPISTELLRDTITKIVQSGIIPLYTTSTNAGFPLVFSTSLINRGVKQVFWDIVSPALKFEGLTVRA